MTPVLWCWVLSGATAFAVAAPLLRRLIHQRHGRRLPALLHAMTACTILYAGNTTLAWILGQPAGIAAWLATTVILAAGTAHLARLRYLQHRRDRARAHTADLTLIKRMRRRR